MTHRQINRWLKRRFSGICWTVIAYYFLMNLVVSAVALTDILKQLLRSFSMGDFRFLPDEQAIANNGWGYCMAGVICLVILYAWKGSAYWKQELFAGNGKMTFRVFLCAMSFCVGAQMLNSIWISILEFVMNGFGTSILPALESVSGSTPTFSMFVYSALAAPVMEEVLFRGYVLRSLRPYGKRFSILASAVLFGLLHGNLIQTPYAIIMGLVFGYLASEYSLKWAIGLHVFNNLVLAEGLDRLTAMLPAEAENLFYSVFFGLGFLISVGILLGKRKEISAWRQGEWIDRRCVICFATNFGFLLFAFLMISNSVAWLVG